MWDKICAYLLRIIEVLEIIPRFFPLDRNKELLPGTGRGSDIQISKVFLVFFFCCLFFYQRKLLHCSLKCSEGLTSGFHSCMCLMRFSKISSAVFLISGSVTIGFRFLGRVLPILASSANIESKHFARAGRGKNSVEQLA